MTDERDPGEVCEALQETLQRFFGGQDTYVRLEPGKADIMRLRVGARVDGRDMEVTFGLDGDPSTRFASLAKSACRSLAWKVMNQMVGLALADDRLGER